MEQKEVRAILAKNIKVNRGYRNWTQADLAEKSGLSIVYLSDIERGNKWPYLDTLIKLANAFKLDVYELLKPGNAPSPTVAGVITKFTEDAAIIFSEALRNAEKNAMRSLASMQKQYKGK